MYILVRVILTCLCTCIYLGVSEQLLASGCDLDHTDDKGRCALHLAVYSEKLSMVELLLGAGCEVNLRDSYGDTPLMLCATKGNSDIMEVLLNSGSQVNIQNNEGDTALHFGARHGKHACVELLIRYQTDMELRNMWQVTGLLYAAECRHEECVLALVRAGADITPQSRNQRTVLHYVASHGLVTCIKALLSKDIDADIPDADGNTPLMNAVLKNKHKAVQELLQHGCKVDYIGQCSFGGAFTFCSPLEAAAHLGYVEVAKMLYAAGGSLNFMHCYDFCYILRSNGCINAWVEEMRSGPRRLLESCRIRLRDMLGIRLRYKAQQLPLPKMLKLYLAYYDLSLLTEE